MSSTESNPYPGDYFYGHIQVLVQKFFLTTNRFFKNELLNHAAAAAFFFILSVTPLFFLILFAFDRYLTSFPEASDIFFSFLKQINDNLDKDLFIKIGLLNTKTTAIGIFGILNLLWAGCWILSAIQRGLAVVFSAGTKRKRVLMNFFSILILVSLLFISVIATLISIGLSLIDTFLESNFVLLNFMQALLPYINQFLPLMVIFVVIFLTYRFVPAQRPGSAAGIIGALWCSIAIVAMHSLISLFYDAARYNVIYGVLGSLIITVIWVHFTFVIFFFFAEYTLVTEKIDVLLLEKMLFNKLENRHKASRFDRLLFDNPRYLFNKFAKTFPAGETLFREGDPIDNIYYICQGQVGIYRRREGVDTYTHSIGAGEFFGEMAYILNKTRTATAVVKTDTRLLIIRPEIFEELLNTNTAFSRDLIEVLSDRLQKTGGIHQTGRLENKAES